MPFNPSDKGPNITLSSGNLVATDTSGGGWASVRSTISKTTGKWYFEVTDTANYVMIGLGTSTATLSSYAGSDANGWGLSSNGGNLYHNGAGGVLHSFTTGAVIGVAFDADARTMQLYDGGSAFGGSIDISALSGAIFPLVTVGFNGVATLNESPASPPSGYTALGGAAGPTITVQPSNQTVTAGSTAGFSVTATSSGGALSYQWQRSVNSGGSWSNVSTGSGGTSASYTTATTTVSGGNANNGDQYRCNVTDSNGTTATSAASLTVNAAAATGYSMSGPSSGVVGVASSNFTVTLTPAGGTSSAATITPSDGGGGGTFTPSTVSLSTGTPSATFTYTAGSAGVKTISVTDSLSLTDPSPISYTASATSTKGGAILALLAGKVL